MLLTVEQLDAALFALGKKKVLLALAPGFGKTATVLTALGPEQLPALVVAPAVVAKESWLGEAAVARPDLRTVLVAGSPDEKRAAVLQDADVTIVSMESLEYIEKARYPNRRVWYKRIKTIICDESVIAKRVGGARRGVLRRISRKTPYIWLMTGTPAERDHMDLYGQIELLDEGKRLGSSFGEFQRRYFKPVAWAPGNVVTKWQILPGAADEINQKIKDIAISSDPPPLPPLTRSTRWVTMPSQTRQVYDELREDSLAVLPNGDVVASSGAGATASKLLQLSCGHVLDTETQQVTWLDQAKFDEIDRIRQEVAPTSIWIFYYFRAEWAKAKERWGDDAVELRQKGALARWNADEVPMLWVQPSSAKWGVNGQFSSARTMVWLRCPYTPGELIQGEARLHRRGQVNPITSYVLASRGTYDTRIPAILTGRKTMHEALMEELRG